MPDNGNAVADAGLTSQEGTPGNEPDLTEEKTVRGLSRTVTKLRQQIAAISAETPSGDPEETVKLKSELATTQKELKKRDIALKYPDVSDFLMKAMDKQKLDPDLVDEEFVAAIREGKAPREDVEDVALNPQRGQPTKAQEDEALLRSLGTLFR